MWVVVLWPRETDAFNPTHYRMISELDIWRTANLLIREHGVDAVLEAARLRDLMLDRADHEGRLVWTRIGRAIEALRAPPSGMPD